MFCRILKGAGAPWVPVRDTETRYEFQNYASFALTKHYLRFGGRLRDIQDTNYSNANFEGTYTYSNLSDYQANKPSQFSITTGTPTQSVGVVDLGLYAEDDWKVRPNFTLSYGLRFETQNHIPNKARFCAACCAFLRPWGRRKAAKNSVARRLWNFLQSIHL